MNPLQFDRITFDPQVMGGKPCIRGMRVTVGTIIGLIASGATADEILDDYSKPRRGRHRGVFAGSTDHTVTRLGGARRGCTETES
jgi:hypothetical protein